MLLLQLHLRAQHIDAGRGARLLAVHGSIVKRLVGQHLRADGCNAGSVGDDLKVAAGNGLHHQIPRILNGELRRAQAFLSRLVRLAGAVIEDGHGSESAQIGVMKRTGDGGDAREVQAKRFEVELLIDLADLPVSLGQQSADRPLPLTAGDLAGGSAGERPQVGLQAALDGVAQGEG